MTTYLLLQIDHDQLIPQLLLDKVKSQVEARAYDLCSANGVKVETSCAQIDAIEMIAGEQVH